jgi:gliding motility-associated-like protein
MALATNPATCGVQNASISIIAANGTPGYTYSNDNGSSFQASNLFNGLSAIAYDLVLQDNNGCQIDSTITLTADLQPVIDNVTYTNPLCFGGNGGTITISSSGGVGVHQYSITSNIGPFQASNNFVGLSDGTYTVYVQDGNGCVVSSLVDLTEPAQIVINSTPTNLTCFQNNTGIINLSITGGTLPFQYSIDNGISFQGTGGFTGLAAGNYDIVVQDNNACQITMLENLTEPTPVIFNAFTVVNPSCYGVCDGTVTANASGGTVAGSYTYTWSNGLASNSSDVAINVCDGTYSLVIKDDNSCANDTLNFIVTEPAQATIDSVLTTPVTCFGDTDGTIDIYSSNADFYSIGAAFSPISNYTGLTSNIYWAYVQDVNGCAGDSALVYVATPQQLNGFVSPDVYICQNDSIFFSVVASGGTAPYFFENNLGLGANPNSQLILEQIMSDTIYYTQITDANGCTFFTDTMTVTVAPPPILITSNDTIICEGEALTLSSQATDLLETYTYLWSSGETGPFIYPTVGNDTTYYVDVTDECNVTTTDSIHVTLFQDPVVTITPNITEGCPPFQVDFDIAVDLTLLASDLSWNTNFGIIDSSNFDHLWVTYSSSGNGSFNLTFTSSNGCLVDTTIMSNVVVHDLPSAAFNVSPSQPTIYDTDVQLINTSLDYTQSQWFILNDTTYLTDANINLSTVPADSAIQACLVVANDFGCTDTTCQTIEIENELFLFVPNTIILDGYSGNTVFKPVTNYFHPDWYQMYIFNRWGELIFETTDLNKGWDGTYNGIVVQEGVYVWKIVGAPLDNEADLKEYYGHVTVLK